MIYRPHDYQTYATRFIEEHPVAALILEMGLGKSVITLTAIEHLMHDSFEVRKVLVIAPLRVAASTWPDEIRKWDHLSSLTFSVAVGTRDERIAALRHNADITIINRENIQWLVEESGAPFDYDMVVIDELSSFKNHRTKRFRSLMKARPKVKRIVASDSQGLPLPTDLWISGLSSVSLTEERGSDASSDSTGRDGSSRTSGIRWSSSPTSRRKARRMRYTAPSRISRSP